MTRHDDPISRLACLRVLRSGRFLFTTHVADRAAMYVRGISRALRRLRTEGLLDRRHDGAWRLNAAGQVVAEYEIKAAEAASRRRQEWEAEKRARRGRTCVDSRRLDPKPPTAVGPYTTEQLALLRGAGALRLHLGPPPPLGCDPGPAAVLPLFGGGMEDLFGPSLFAGATAPPVLDRLTQEAKDGPQAARGGEDRQGVGVDEGHPPDGDDRGPAPPG